MTDSILIQGHREILEIVLNRPEVYNALNLDVMVMLSDPLAGHSNGQEGIKVFLEKRKPVF